MSSGLDLTTRIVTKLIPREAIAYAEDRSTRGKIDCFDVASQNPMTPETAYSVRHIRRDDTWACSCKAHEINGWCKHADSVRFYIAERAASKSLAFAAPEVLRERDADLAAAHADLPLSWEARAEWSAIGQLLAAIFAADDAPAGQEVA